MGVAPDSGCAAARMPGTPAGRSMQARLAENLRDLPSTHYTTRLWQARFARTPGNPVSFDDESGRRG